MRDDVQQVCAPLQKRRTGGVVVDTAHNVEQTTHGCHLYSLCHKFEWFPPPVSETMRQIWYGPIVYLGAVGDSFE